MAIRGGKPNDRRVAPNLIVKDAARALEFYRRVLGAEPIYVSRLPSGAVLWLVLSLVLGAFAEEIFWAGILSVRKGQWEAARSTGLGFAQTLAYVILPQAIRLTVPPLTNRTIAITKNTALGSVIGVPEILNVATTTESFIGNATPLTMGAIAYVALFVPVLAGLYAKGVMQVAALCSIFVALAATLVAMRVGSGMLSPQAVGILTGAVVMLVFGVVRRKAYPRG